MLYKNGYVGTLSSDLEHSEIIGILALLGENISVHNLPLGGGYLTLDHVANTAAAGGSSGMLGAAPKPVLENSLKLHGYSITATGDDLYYPASRSNKDVTRWFQIHGFETANRSGK
ncbi:MAG TPA: hypothetical protein VJJ52_04435 [Candidatus Nanoarchaeia archaeon]|nr:hypothetical protein [Candidatus Nanoarchaeia archaeon]